MKKETIMFILGSLVGAGAAYLATTRKEEIMEKLQELQEQLKDSDLPERAKNLVKEIAENIQTLIMSPEEELSEEEKKDILDEVESKIQKLEEAIKGDETEA
ncbi:YtxH domain-containing protein [Desulfurobacterium sp.]